MKKRNLVLSVMTTCLVSCFLLSGCNGQKQIDSETVKTVKVEEQAHLQDDTVSPACKITIDYSYLAESDAADSIAQRINRTIQAHVLGKEYIRMNPEVAVDSFKNTYINNYRKDVNEFYQEDIKNGTPKDELPTWYNYEYGLTTHFKASSLPVFFSKFIHLFHELGCAPPVYSKVSAMKFRMPSLPSLKWVVSPYS